MSELTVEDVRGWLNRYVEAWRSYEPDAIGGLFTEDAKYRYRPGDEPLEGREAIVADWLKEPDEPGSWTADYRVWSVTGDRAAAWGETAYSAEGNHYFNVFLMKFRDGRCCDFVEYFMKA